MFSTPDVIRLLRESNPAANVSENRVRHALRRGTVARPAIFSGRLIWTIEDVVRIASALGLKVPSVVDSERAAS